jgi:hypothetical protein
VNECVIVRAHDRSLPLKLRMFFSSNRAQKSFSAEENKEAAQDWESPKVKREKRGEGGGRSLVKLDLLLWRCSIVYLTAT